MSRFSSAALLGPVITASLALGAAGCQDKACLEWTEPALACPPREEALARMTVACGDQNVESVDGDGEFDTLEEECCYDVTRFDAPRYACEGPIGSGGTGGPDAGVCLSCRQWLEDASSTYADLCSPAKALYDALASCVCFDSCGTECFETACNGVEPPQTCNLCVDSKCSAEIDASANDL
jgi:hypothetical protein